MQIWRTHCGEVGSSRSDTPKDARGIGYPQGLVTAAHSRIYMGVGNPENSRQQSTRSVLLIFWNFAAFVKVGSTIFICGGRYPMLGNRNLVAARLSRSQLRREIVKLGSSRIISSSVSSSQARCIFCRKPPAEKLWVCFVTSCTLASSGLNHRQLARGCDPRISTSNRHLFMHRVELS